MTAGIVVTGALALLAAVGVVGFRETIYSALSLAANVVLLAVLFLLLNAQFLAAVQVIIYAGAVMVLFVFIIALLNPGAEEEHPARDPRFGLGLVVLAYITVQVYALATNGTTYDKNSSQHQLRGVTIARQADPRDTSFGFTPDVVNSGGNVQTVGGQLFTTFILPFEITSAILLVAAIGAVYLTRKPPPPRT